MGSECPLAKSNAEFKCCARNLVFFLEFLINDGVCLIYEGNSTPGHFSKSSLLNREVRCMDTRHRDACTEELLVGALPPRQ